MGLQSAMEALPEALLPEQRACFMEDLSEQHLWAYLLQQLGNHKEHQQTSSCHQDRNKCGMSAMMSTVVESWTSSTCFRAGTLRQAQSAFSMTCSCLRRRWRASTQGTGYTSCLCCCRWRLSCESTTSLCTPPCCPSATTHNAHLQVVIPDNDRSLS